MPPVRVRDPEDLFQRDAKRALDELQGSPLLLGKQVTATLGTTPSRVFHDLGRPVVGFLLAFCEDDTRVWSSGTNGPKFIELTANDTRTVQLWIY